MRLRRCCLAVFLLGWLALALTVRSAEPLLQTGQYDAAAQLAAAEVERGVWNEKWPRMLMQAHLARGRYAEAIEAYDQAIGRYSNSISLRMLVHQALLANGQVEAAARIDAEIMQILQRPAGRFASSDNLVAAGRFLARRRQDARQILEKYYDRVRAVEPNHLEAAIATAELAIEKGDYQVAAKTLEDSRRLESGDPRVDYLMSRALAPSDPEAAREALQLALDRNPRHVPSLLALVDAAIDREADKEADQILTRVLQVNLHEPLAWAYQAVLAHLRGQGEIQRLMRAAALSTWAENPEVDHRIGRKLARLYRFAEAAQYQRRALAFDPEHPGAKFHLAETLLRLGEHDEGWRQAQTVARDDPYNVVAYNLVTLYDRLQQFATLSRPGLFVRMSPHEAAVYGEAVLDLLDEARQTLCEKYQVSPDGPVVVEIFPEQKDFAIRTFGLPGGAGLLGVCFGRVITANSPASQGARPSNWQSVLWHEFCHTVTLEKTNNRLPRWLSEGISVYEERQREPASGASMTPRYREWLLDESLTPVSRLSGAFLAPQSPLHLQFAYYQSSLVVEFLIQRHGFETLLQVLHDLGDGLPINDALGRRLGSIQRLDVEFAEYARQIAEAFGQQADWSRDQLPERASAGQWLRWNEQHPDNVWGLTRWAESLVAAGRDDEALQPLQRLQQLGVAVAGRGGTLEMLAGVYRRLQRPEEERQVLRAVIAATDNALPALQRLAALALQDNDWPQLANLAERILAIQPLLPAGHRMLAEAAERTGADRQVVRALGALAEFDPVDPAGLDYRIAAAHHRLGHQERARRHLIAALRQAPRYRQALSLLLDVTGSDETEDDDES